MNRVFAAGAVLMTLAMTTAAVAAESAPRYLYMGGGAGAGQGTVAGFLDLGSLAREGDRVTLPILLIPDTPEAGAQGKNFGIVSQTFDCKARTEQTRVYRAYTATGALLSETPLTMPVKPIDPNQSEAMEAIAMACGEATPAPDQPTFTDPLDAAKWSRARPPRAS